MDTILASLKAAGEPTRLRLLVLCAHMDLTVTQLTQILGQSQPRVSRHLKLLSEAGLLERFREGSWIFYRMAMRGQAAALGQMLVDLLPDDDPTLTLDMKRLAAVQQARAELAASYFKGIACDWDRIRGLYIDESEVEARLLELLPPGEADDLLDIGTGTGRILEVLGPRVKHALGVDFSPEMLTVARANLERSGLRNSQVRLGDMYQLPLPDRSFDRITLHQVLHFAERPQAVLNEAARVLRPGGQVLLVDFAKHGLEDLREHHHHQWLGFDDETVDGWMEIAGLQLTPPVELPGNPLSVRIWAAGRPEDSQQKQLH